MISRSQTETERFMKILVVDDAAITRVMLRMVLQKAGHEVVEAADLPSGLATLFKQKPDFVFTDLNLAGDSGFELFSEIIKLYPFVPVVLMTASNDAKVRTQALASGMRDVLFKPLSPDRILELVAAHARPAEKAKARISVHLDVATLDQARALAKSKNQTLEDVVRDIVTEHLKAPVNA